MRLNILKHHRSIYQLIETRGAATILNLCRARNVHSDNPVQPAAEHSTYEVRSTHGHSKATRRHASSNASATTASPRPSRCWPRSRSASSPAPSSPARSAARSRPSTPPTRVRWPSPARSTSPTTSRKIAKDVGPAVVNINTVTLPKQSANSPAPPRPAAASPRPTATTATRAARPGRHAGLLQPLLRRPGRPGRR